MSALRLLDIIGFVIGLVYLYLEYKASIWLWLAGVVMPAVDMVLYFKAGLYADFGLAIYYCLASVYGFVVWQFSGKSGSSGTSGPSDSSGAEALPITHFRRSYILPAILVFMALWFAIWWVLAEHTPSTVPVTDAFTTALSIVAMWALARKYVEQWLLWLVIDAVCVALYVYKGLPFKALLYAFYTVVAVLGYRKWLREATRN